jgi:hypothetical protein
MSKNFTPPFGSPYLFIRSLFFKEFNVVVQIMLKPHCSRLLMGGTKVFSNPDMSLSEGGM